MPMRKPSAVVVGGTAGLGLQIAKALVEHGGQVVVTGRNAERTTAAAAQLGDSARGLSVDLTQPDEIAASLSSVDSVQHLVIAAMERDRNPVRNYDIAAASRVITLKLVGYTEVVHALAPQMTDDSSIVLIGGLAMSRPQPGSTTITTVNGGISALVRSLAAEIAPVRVNAVHPGLIGDSPRWTNRTDVVETLRSRVPTHRLVATDDVVDSVLFLLRNKSMNGTNLIIDSGESIT